MTIRYIDTYSTQLFHLQINTCILKMLYDLYPGKVVYYSSISSRTNVIDLCKELSVVSHHPIFVINPHNKVTAVLRTFFSVFQNIRLLLFSKSDDLLIYNYDNVFSLPLTNTTNKFLKRKIIVICHGELELLLPGDNRGVFIKIMSGILKSFFSEGRRYDDNITYCVLGKSILDNVKKILPIKAGCHFAYFDHPYIYKDLTNKKERGEILNVGIVGTFSEGKGAPEFVWLVRQLQNCKNLRFSVTGTITSRLEELKSLGISLPSNFGQGQVTRKEFSNRLKELDFILFLYPQDSYKLTASGAIMDAIEWGIPVLAIKNDYFCNIFDNYGPFGCLVDNKHELKDLILSFINNYDDLKIDFSSIRMKSSPEAISKQLKKIVYNII